MIELCLLRLQVFLEGSTGVREAGRAVCLRIRFIPGEERRRSLLQLFVREIEALLDLQQLGGRRGQDALCPVRPEIHLECVRVIPGFRQAALLRPLHVVAQQTFQQRLHQGSGHRQVLFLQDLAKCLGQNGCRFRALQIFAERILQFPRACRAGGGQIGVVARHQILRQGGELVGCHVPVELPRQRGEIEISHVYVGEIQRREIQGREVNILPARNR